MLQIKPLDHFPEGQLSRGTPDSAGLDIRAAIPHPQILHPYSTMKIPTGFCMALPTGYVALIFPRSGLATKHRVTLVNTVGVIDSDYRDEVLVALVNGAVDPFVINPGDRIAQMVIGPTVLVEPKLVEDLPPSDRLGGFGHTGVE